jgi:hypothetical protein
MTGIKRATKLNDDKKRFATSSKNMQRAAIRKNIESLQTCKNFVILTTDKAKIFAP